MKVGSAPTTTPNTKKGKSSARARVRALYEARKTRIMSKRSASSDFSANPKQAKISCQDGDKENCYSPNSAVPGKKPATRKSLPPKVSTKKLLTPIREEADHRRFSSKCINNNVVFSPRTPLSDIEGDYVTLKSPANKRDDIPMTPKSHKVPKSSSMTCKLDETSIWVDSATCKGPTSPIYQETVPNALRLSNADISPIAQHESPKFASSDAISELYTSKVLTDISTISSARNMTLREQVSSANLPGAMDGALHSTFNYPLHSTMNYPLHSTINFFDEGNSKMTPKSPVSQTTAVIRSKSRSSTRAQFSLPRESSGVRLNNLIEPPQTQLPTRQYSAADFKTPTKKPQATLCKEHGLHPTFGGPCIFQTDDALTTLDSSSSLEDEEAGRRPYLDTDCDSSYLSECVDDVTFSQGEDYTATYDARTARMRMLKRQTGQTELQRDEEDLRYPIGLSESDLNLDITRKHLSLEATRASLPDLSGLSTLASEEESESTLHASSRRPGDSTDDILSQNETLVSVTSDHRPLSVATTDDSPESAASLQVPVNSPNITDSGGSSSRPTTDTYDYVELPAVNNNDNFKVPTLPPPKRRTVAHSRTHSSQQKAHSDSKSLRSYKSHRSNKSGRSSKSHQPSRSHNEWDYGMSTNTETQPRHGGGHIDIIDTAGTKRTVVQHFSVSKNLQPDRKKQLVKKLKKFNNNFNRTDNNTNMHIKTLGHF